ncbi:MAG: hypothetical protein FWD71_09195 [Oscillospiraceae bacterium]|nr:hypothetical protein [Oscillospiraceae bacterium]
MNKEKSDYRRGLLYFACLMICICLFFTTPDRDTLFYKFLGLFGIKPGINIGNNATLYIYMLIPLIAGILSIRKVLAYWRSYGIKFKEYNVFLRFLPGFIIVLVFLFSANINSIYYTVIGLRGGLQSIVYYSDSYNDFSFNYTENIQTYSYYLTFKNCSNKTVEFSVKLTEYDDFPDVLIKDYNGEVKTFILPPKQTGTYTGKFTENAKTKYSSANGSYPADSIILLNDKEQYSPKPINKSQRK